MIPVPDAQLVPPGARLSEKGYNAIKFTVNFVFPVNQFDLFVHMQRNGLISPNQKRSDVVILRENILIKEITYLNHGAINHDADKFFDGDGKPITNFNWKIWGLNPDHAISLDPTHTGNNGIGDAAHSITLNIIAHVRLPQFTTTHSCDGKTKPDTKDKEECEKMKEFMLARAGGSLGFNVGLDINSNLVISPAPFLSEEKYKRYDAKTNRIINVEGFVFKYNDFCKVLNVQVKDIAVGDIICGEKAVIAVKKINKNGIITGISFDDNTEVTIIPESFMGTDICIVEKLVNLMNPGKIDNMMIMLNTGEENNKMDKKTMIMMMAMQQNQNGNGNMNTMLPILMMDDDIKNDKALMLMMMQQNNGMKMDMNSMLPLMLLDDNGDKKDMLKTMMIMNMMNQQNNKKEQ